MTRWQPIETWDGQAALLCSMNKQVFMWSNGSAPSIEGVLPLVQQHEITHWMPLPPAPTDEQAERWHCYHHLKAENERLREALEEIADKRNLCAPSKKNSPFDEYDKGYLDGVGMFQMIAREAPKGGE